MPTFGFDTSSWRAKLEQVKANIPRAVKASATVLLTYAQQSIKDSGPGWVPFKKLPKDGHQLLYWKGTLLQSLSIGDSNNIYNVTDDTLTVGSNLAYARAQNAGYAPRNLPARPFLYVDEKRARDMNQAFLKYLYQGT